MQSHIRKVYACLAVTCHLHFWQNDRDLLHATAVTRGWNGYRNKSQHRKLDLEKKNFPSLLQGFEPASFQSRVRRSKPRSYPRPLQLQELPLVDRTVRNLVRAVHAMRVARAMPAHSADFARALRAFLPTCSTKELWHATSHEFNRKVGLKALTMSVYMYTSVYRLDIIIIIIITAVICIAPYLINKGEHTLLYKTNVSTINV